MKKAQISIKKHPVKSEIFLKNRKSKRHISYMHTPKISIVIPIKTKKCFFRACIFSLLKQTFSSFELICVIDGEGECNEYLKEFSHLDNRIRPFFLKESHGAAYCRNFGISKAKGKYIQFLDSDDCFDSHMLEKMHLCAEQHETDIVICAANFLDNISGSVSKIGCSLNIKGIKQPVFSKESIVDIYKISSTSVWNKLYSLNFIRQNHLKFQQISSSNDTAFGLLSMLLANRISYVNEAFIFYRINQSASTTAKRNILNALKVCKFVFHEFRKRPFLKKYRRLLDTPLWGSLLYELSFPRKLQEQNYLMKQYKKYLLPKTQKLLAKRQKNHICLVQIINTIENLSFICQSISGQKYQNFEWIIISSIPEAELKYWIEIYINRVDRMIFSEKDEIENNITNIKKEKSEWYFIVLKDGYSLLDNSFLTLSNAKQSQNTIFVNKVLPVNGKIYLAEEKHTITRQ